MTSQGEQMNIQMNTKDQRFGLVLLGAAGLVALAALNSSVASFFWLGAMSLGFFWAHKRTGQNGFIVPAGVLGGIALGSLLEGITPFDGIFLLGFAGGFWAIRTLEPRAHAWAIYPAWVFTALAALIFITENAWLISLGLVLTGVYLLSKRNSKPVSSHTEITIPTPGKLERLQVWRSQTAAQSNLPEAEVLRTEQLERLSKLEPENVDALFGVLDTAQIERYGKSLLELLRT
jgi:hypothetical protein